MKIKIFLSCFFWMLLSDAFAQPSLLKLQGAVKKGGNGEPVYSVFLSPGSKPLATVKFRASEGVARASVPAWINEKLEMRSGVDELRITGKLVTKTGLTIEKMQQYYKGIKVAYGVVSVLSNPAGKATLLQFEFFSIANDIETRAAISEDAALQKATQYIGASKYAWEGYTGTDKRYMKPKGELVILNMGLAPSENRLCYTYNIFAEVPYGYHVTFVDAITGAVLSSDNQLHFCNETKRETKIAPVPVLDDSPPAIAFNKKHVKQNDSVDFLSDHDVEKSLQNRPSHTPNSIVIGSGNTRYSGYMADVQTEDGSGVAGRPYMLRAIGFNFTPGIDITTWNYKRKAYNLANHVNIAQFTDDNNNWNEYEDTAIYAAKTNDTLSGFEVHFNMLHVTDYWYQRHGRRGWDNKPEGETSFLQSFVNADITLVSGDNDNAFWDPALKAMAFGLGELSPTNQRGGQPCISLDVTAHEVGHGICEVIVDTDNADPNGLRYRGESGALNEGFSDIWSACIDNYFNEKYSLMPLYYKDPWIIGNEHILSGYFRNFANPKAKGKPDTYKSVGNNWKDTLINPTITLKNQDWGGVHTNSALLVKWFNLITAGGSGTNDKGFNYSLTGMGFMKAEQLAYATEAALPFDCDYPTAKEISIGIAETMTAIITPEGLTQEELRNVKLAWAAVGVDSQIVVYDMVNTPLFTTNNFSNITVGKDGHVWAGTDKNGLYKFNGTNWEKAQTAISGYNINGMSTDKHGGVWIASSGRDNAFLYAGGGLFYYPEADFTSVSHFDTTEGLCTRNVRGIFIDTAYSGSVNPRVWASHFAHRSTADNPNSFLKGGFSFGLLPNDRFGKLTEHIPPPHQ